MSGPEWLVELVSTQIDRKIVEDGRTTPTTFLGWPRDRVFEEVIQGGQADFDAAIGSLTGDDRALLYAKYNQPRHLDELRHAFGLLLGEHKNISKPTLIDIGCGPFTAGLSFAAALGPSEPFRYFGVDRAASMLALGESLYAEARPLGAFHRDTTAVFEQDLEALDFGPVRGEWAIVVASYLLASPTVDAAGLAAVILTALSRVGPGPAVVLYTNSAAARAGEKYPAFRDALQNGGFKIVTDVVERFVHTGKTPKDVHYALFFRPERNVISLMEARQ
ncbi:hypothetical protein [Ralstonia sp. Ralssp110]|uniref:hypothetical protein n=1 Tax=Ralstonia sp. Ralssp110 TaxID=3243004 RepID=UPI0039B5FA10